MPNEQFQARLRPEVAERVHQYKDEKGLGKGAATARLLEQGIEAIEGRDGHDPDALLERVALALAIAGLVSMWGFFAAWSFFDWALVEPVIVMAVLTAAYLTVGWGVNRLAREWRAP